MKRNVKIYLHWWLGSWNQLFLRKWWILVAGNLIYNESYHTFLDYACMGFSNIVSTGVSWIMYDIEPFFKSLFRTLLLLLLLFVVFSMFVDFMNWVYRSWREFNYRESSCSRCKNGVKLTSVVMNSWRRDSCQGFGRFVKPFLASTEHEKRNYITIKLYTRMKWLE